MANAYCQVALCPAWSPPKFAIAATQPIVDAPPVSANAARKKEKRKRKREQATVDVLNASKMPKLKDERREDPFCDPILAACRGDVNQRLDYPQHIFCAPYIENALHELNQAPRCPDQEFPDSEEDNFDGFMTHWQSMKGEDSVLDIRPNITLADQAQLWNRPVRQSSDSAVRITSANADWIIPPRSSFLMVCRSLHVQPSRLCQFSRSTFLPV